MIVLLACLAALATAQNQTTLNGTAANGHAFANGTVELLILDGAWPGHSGYAASLVEACADRTVYAVECTQAVEPNATLPDDGSAVGYPPYSGNWNDLGNILGPIPQMCNWEPGRVNEITAGPSVWIMTTTSLRAPWGSTNTTWGSVSCTLWNDQASCNAFQATSNKDHVTTRTADWIWSNLNAYVTQIPLTGGAYKTANPTGSCETPIAAPTAPSTSIENNSSGRTSVGARLAVATGLGIRTVIFVGLASVLLL